MIHRNSGHLNELTWSILILVSLLSGCSSQTSSTTKRLLALPNTSEAAQAVGNIYPSPDGRTIVFFTGSSAVIYDVGSGAQKRSNDPDVLQAPYRAWEPDGQTFLLGSERRLGETIGGEVSTPASSFMFEATERVARLEHPFVSSFDWNDEKVNELTARLNTEFQLWNNPTFKRFEQHMIGGNWPQLSVYAMFLKQDRAFVQGSFASSQQSELEKSSLSSVPVYQNDQGLNSGFIWARYAPADAALILASADPQFPKTIQMIQARSNRSSFSKDEFILNPNMAMSIVYVSNSIDEQRAELIGILGHSDGRDFPLVRHVAGPRDRTVRITKLWLSTDRTALAYLLSGDRKRGDQFEKYSDLYVIPRKIPAITPMADPMVPQKIDEHVRTAAWAGTTGQLFYVRKNDGIVIAAPTLIEIGASPGSLEKAENSQRKLGSKDIFVGILEQAYIDHGKGYFWLSLEDGRPAQIEIPESLWRTLTATDEPTSYFDPNNSTKKRVKVLDADGAEPVRMDISSLGEHARKRAEEFNARGVVKIKLTKKSTVTLE